MTGTNNKGPYLLINSTLNLVGEKDLSLRGRKSTLFFFSKLYCGSDPTSYCKTEKYENGDFDLATAMAISGAAFNSQMGEKTNHPTAFLMTLFNLRLGSWLQNPGRRMFISNRVAWPLYLLRELLSLTDAETPFCNISDGGHFENLGVYSLLRRHCRFIIVSDAGEDPNFSFEDLGNALRKARIDFGIHIKFYNGTLNSQMHWATGDIEYPDGQKGTLVLIKPSIAGNEPEDVLAYRRLHQNFPQETTMDQFFTEAQFESYRALGYEIAKEIFYPCQTIFEREDGNLVEKVFKNIGLRGQGPFPKQGCCDSPAM